MKQSQDEYVPCFYGIHNRYAVMQHSSLNPLLSNEDGVCGAYLGGYLFVSGGWRAVLCHHDSSSDL